MEKSQKMELLRQDFRETVEAIVLAYDDNDCDGQERELLTTLAFVSSKFTECYQTLKTR